MNTAPSLMSTSLRALFSLIAVIGMIYLFMYILRKFSFFQGKISGRKGIIEIVGKLSLSPKKTIYLIRVGKKILVVGVDGGFHLLLSIEDDEVVKSVQQDSAVPTPSGLFSQQFKKMLFSTSRKLNGVLFHNLGEIKKND